jgi:hypothetical protein
MDEPENAPKPAREDLCAVCAQNERFADTDMCLSCFADVNDIVQKMVGGDD